MRYVAHFMARNEDPERGRRIRQLRRERGYTSGKALAEALSVHPRSIDNWEGGRSIDGPNLARLAELLGVTPQYLWTGSDDNGEAVDPVAVLRHRVDALEGRLVQDAGDRPVALRAHDKRVEDELATIKGLLEGLERSQKATARLLPRLAAAVEGLQLEVAELRSRRTGQGTSERSS